MTNLIQAIRGMNDILPPESALWQSVENKFKAVFQHFCYQEIRFPIVEKTELFKRSIGEVSDIVEKEMYTFLDRNGDSLTLRPEGTASIVRAGIEHGILYNKLQRLWYNGPYFRHERPQKGRYRQFHQFGAEMFGIETPDADAEIIILTAALLEKINLTKKVKLQINSLGTSASRIEHRKKLIEYFNKRRALLDEDSLNRLEKNPLRILDSKNPALKEIIMKAPKLIDFLDEDALNHFEKVRSYLTAAGVSFEVNPYLVRGLDYYTKTVFEWVTTELGAQGTVCGGGRYDALVEQLGGKKTPAVGFSLGMERIILLLSQQNKLEDYQVFPDVYLITDGEAAYFSGLKLAHYLRRKVPTLKLLVHCGGGNIKTQFKKADKSGAKYAIIIGEHELKTQSISLKSLREQIPQQSLYQDELAEYLVLKIANHKEH